MNELRRALRRSTVLLGSYVVSEVGAIRGTYFPGTLRFRGLNMDELRRALRRSAVLLGSCLVSEVWLSGGTWLEEPSSGTSILIGARRYPGDMVMRVPLIVV